MRIRFWAPDVGLVTAATVTVFALLGTYSKELAPSALAASAHFRTTALSNLPKHAFAASQSDTAPDFRPPVLSAATTWSREIAPGDTLDGVLTEAGLSATARAEVALAIAAEFDLRRLRPGHIVTVVSTAESSPLSVALAIDDGVQIEAVFGEQLSARVVVPNPEVVTRAGETVIESSVFAALAEADIPIRFAVDLAQMLSGTVDFRRELAGGETLRLLWREARVGNETIGQPDLLFAGLEIGDSLFEVVWPDDGSGRATIYVNGEMLRVFAQPVEGARLSSVFGRRTHPVFGSVRMHTGVDFSAARGTPVQATAPGRITYIGWRGGYGRVVEIAHGSDTVTRYAHLSTVSVGLAEGQRVMAGDVIGGVGATGTVTGSNLHYEVLVDGRPTDPLSDTRLAEVARLETQNSEALARLNDARAQLANELSRTTAERI